MRPIYGCPENFRDSMTTPTATTSSWLLFWLTLWMCAQNLKFVALPVPGIIGGRQKLGRSLAMPTLSIPQKYICLPYRLFIHAHSFSRDFRLQWELWMTRHFSTKSRKNRDTSAPGQFGRDTSALVPKCLETLRHRCLRHFGTGSRKNRETYRIYVATCAVLCKCINIIINV